MQNNFLAEYILKLFPVHKYVVVLKKKEFWILLRDTYRCF